METFAATAARQLRGDDIIARIGGEEFAVLLHTNDMEQARVICERVRNAIAAASTHDGDRNIVVTVSGGVTAMLADNDATLKSADAALYNAKASGRNQLAIAA